MANSGIFPQRHCPDMEIHSPHVWEHEGSHWNCIGYPQTAAPVNLLREQFMITLNLGDTHKLSPKVHRIMGGPAKEALELYAKRASDYTDTDGFDPSDVLGLQGQFAEVWRKVWKLKNSLWDGREMTGEGPREILMDLVGHCLLAIDMIDRRGGDSGGQVGKVA